MLSRHNHSSERRFFGNETEEEEAQPRLTDLVVDSATLSVMLESIDYTMCVIQRPTTSVSIPALHVHI